MLRVYVQEQGAIKLLSPHFGNDPRAKKTNQAQAQDQDSRWTGVQ